MKIFGINFGKEKGVQKAPEVVLAPTGKGNATPIAIPNSRISSPTYETGYADVLNNASKTVQTLRHQFQIDMIPIIRKLAIVNFDIAQALDNFVQLGNPGHDIIFDNSVPADQQAKMKSHLESRFKGWGDSEAGIDGLVNKKMSQILIAGCLSSEWVPNKDLTGIENVVLVNPETVVFQYNTRLSRHEPYQRVSSDRKDAKDGMVKLNPNTYKYSGLNGDTDLPYGFPPFLAAMDPLTLQRVMLSSIRYLSEQVGAGFLQTLVEKPEKRNNETDAQHRARCEAILQEVAARVKQGQRNGTVVGFKEEIEFEYTSIAQSLADFTKIFELNEQMLASGTKTDGTMLGRNSGTSETHITVVFSKLLAQLRNIQNIVKDDLEFGYSLELKLAGFKFTSLKVVFKQSSVVDELKSEQAKEVKIRNLLAQYNQGIINNDEVARQMGYETADQKEPRYVANGAITPAEAKADREAKKDKSDRAVRDKNRPRPKKLSTCPHCSAAALEEELICRVCTTSLIEQDA